MSLWAYGVGQNYAGPQRSRGGAMALSVFGDYAQRAAPNLLIASQYERRPTEVADLKGARLVFSVEVDQEKRLAEAQVKDLSGGDRKKARFMRQDYFEFEQTFDIVLSVKHKPVVLGTDPGIWRRIRLIPFETQIPVKEQRPQDALVSDLLQDRAAILNWLIAGLHDYPKDPKWVAEEVQSATDTYREEMDHIGKFIADACEIIPRATVPVAKLYATYLAWCRQQDEDPVHKNAFGTAM